MISYKNGLLLWNYKSSALTMLRALSSAGERRPIEGAGIQELCRQGNIFFLNINNFVFCKLKCSCLIEVKCNNMYKHQVYAFKPYKTAKVVVFEITVNLFTITSDLQNDTAIL